MNLIELEQKARQLQADKKYAEATHAWRELIDARPDYEHGTPYYMLACCLEDCGQLREAEAFFRKAVTLDEENSIFLGGLAEFLFLNGTAKEALQFHYRYVQVVGEHSPLAQRARPSIAELELRIKQGF